MLFLFIYKGVVNEMAKYSFKTGDMAFIIENNANVKCIEIMKQAGNLFTVKLNRSVIRIPSHRLYPTEEEAKNNIIVHAKEKTIYKSPYDYM